MEQDAQVSVNIRILELELAINYNLFQTDHWINYTTNQYYVDSDWSIVTFCGQMFFCFFNKCITLRSLFSPHEENKTKLNILSLFTYLFGSLVHKGNRKTVEY